VWLSGGSEEAEAGAATTAIYKKKPGTAVTTVDTVGPVVETEMVKLTDTQLEPTDNANDVSCIHYVYILRL